MCDGYKRANGKLSLRYSGFRATKKKGKKEKKRHPVYALCVDGYTEERLLGNNNDVLRGGGDGDNHSKKLYSQGLYRTFDTATET